MKILNLVVVTKNKNSLKTFLLFFNEHINKNFNCVKKSFPKIKSKTIFTLLKSPHVNKTAQEQFEIKVLTLQLSIIASQIFKFLIFLKKLKNNIFADINFKVKFLTDLKKDNLFKKKLLNIDKFKSNPYYYQKKKMGLKKIKKFKIIETIAYSNTSYKYLNAKHVLKLIDLYGTL